MSSVVDDTAAIPEYKPLSGSNQASSEPPRSYEITVRIEKPMLRRVLRKLLNSYLGRKRYVAALVFGYAVTTLLLKQNYSWYTWVLAGLLIIVVVLPMLLRSLMFLRWLRAYQAEQGEAACYRFDDEGIEARVANGQGQMPWQEFNRLLRLDEAWLLFTRGNAFTILPLRDLSPGLRELIMGKIEANDGEII
ncbi:MAG: YcxB family protein [Nitrococcus mobilis]|nr:YcxB family protein [Nitrococcus mobilis]